MIWPQYAIIDPIITFVFAFIVLLTTIPILIDVCRIFMEGTPKNLDTKKLIDDLLKVKISNNKSIKNIILGAWS
jgi:Co/Zn/Cd efflux system component